MLTFASFALKYQHKIPIQDGIYVLGLSFPITKTLKFRGRE